MEVLGKVHNYKPLYANECESVFGVELSPIEHCTQSNVDGVMVIMTVIMVEIMVMLLME